MSARRTPRADRRASFGTVRRLPSGRYQARYTDADGVRRHAPRTFAERADAQNWITVHRADHLTGSWRSPELGAIELGDYLADYLAGRVELAPRTATLYATLVSRWVDVELLHPAGRLVHLARIELRHLTPAHLADWHAAALAHGQQRAAERLAAADRHRRTRALHAARQWARENGLPVKDVGRLPAAVIEAWRASGAPAVATFDLPTSVLARNAGRTQVAHAYTLLRAALGAAHRDGLIGANPCTLRNTGPGKAPERPTATPAEVATIAEHVPGWLSAAVVVAAWSGLRAGELFALTRAHVDLDAGTVRVDRAVVELPGQPIRFGPPKSVTSHRTVHLPPPVVGILAEHLAHHARPGPDALVFPGPDGRPLLKATRSKVFRRACDGLGLHRLRWHDLRHTGATLAAQNGASLRELQARLGHATVVAAMTYQHATAERDRELAQRMGAAVPANTTVSALRVVR